MNTHLALARANSPTPKPDWTDASDVERILRVRRSLDVRPSLKDAVEIVDAAADGQVIVKLRNTLSADKRGTLLLDLEAFLKEVVDEGLTVWHEALGDKNSLRNLRGIEVRA